MSEDLSTDQAHLRKYLDRAEVLEATVAQLRKDLSLTDRDLKVPVLNDSTFEVLRISVLPRLEELQGQGAHALQVAIYRVDITEKRMRTVIASGGIDALAAEVVLRCLQKVLTRLRFAGRY